jgi:hemin uptake protein HemP
MDTRTADGFGHRTRGAGQPPQGAERKASSVRTLSSASLFQGDHEIGIEHHGALYRLKITRQGKLILNK